MRLARPLLLAWLGLALSRLAVPLTAQGTEGSLEAFLKRVRAERDSERGRLKPLVEELMARLGQVRSAAEIKKAQTDLDALGGEAVPLVVPYLDPGPSAKPEQEKQAQEAAVWLTRAHGSAPLDELVRLAQTASPLGRRLAMRVLAASPEVERALRALQELYPTLSGPLRAECVQALGRLKRDDPLIVTALGDTHPEVLSAAVRVLCDEPRKLPRPEVVALLRDENRGADVLADLVDYFCYPGQELDEEMVIVLVRFACREDLPVDARLKVLDGLPRFVTSLSSRLRRELEPLLSSSDSAIRDAALIALTWLKDSRARRELMRFYDEQVQNNENWPLAYQRRGDIELRIGEYKDAVRDYQDAIRLHGESAKFPGNRELWVNLARAYVHDNKLKAAADALSDFGLSSDLRRTLKADPDFQPLVEHPRYKSLFE